MERLRKRIAGIPRELKPPKEVTLTAESAMRAAADHAHDDPPRVPLPEPGDEPEFAPDMTVWEGLTRG